MKTRSLLFSAFAAALIAGGTASAAAPTPGSNEPSSMQSESHDMQGTGEYEKNPHRMGHRGREGMPGGRADMMRGGMMSGPMMSMMGQCPMMEGLSGANTKVLMQMHGEMMRAMGEIMIKYADKFETPPSR